MKAIKLPKQKSQKLYGFTAAKTRNTAAGRETDPTSITSITTTHIWAL